MYTYIYITGSLCYTPETNTILQINYTSMKKKNIALCGKKDLIHFTSNFCGSISEPTVLSTFLQVIGGQSTASGLTSI